MDHSLIQNNFKCVKCQSNECLIGGLAATGKGLSKIFDIQVNKFTTVVCKKCGYTEFYSDSISGKLTGADWADIFIGG